MNLPKVQPDHVALSWQIVRSHLLPTMSSTNTFRCESPLKPHYSKCCLHYPQYQHHLEFVRNSDSWAPAQISSWFAGMVHLEKHCSKAMPSCLPVLVAHYFLSVVQYTTKLVLKITFLTWTTTANFKKHRA